MKKIYYLLFLLTVLMTLPSCTSEVDDVFDKSPAVRIEEAISADKDILKSASNGWLMEYYGDAKYGGYNMLCKFNADNTVTVKNEVFGADTAYTSHFKLEQSQGVVLSFDEYNPLFHFFSDPANPAGVGDNGKGMYGDFEFRVLSASADSVVLLGKKHNSKIVMTPLAKDVKWDDYLNKLDETAKKMSSKKYAIVIDGTSIPVSQSYRTLTFTDPKTGNDVTMTYIQTPTGFKLREPVTYSGKTITGFTYSDDDSWLDPADKSIKLVPVTPTITEQFVGNYWFIAYSKLGAFGQQYWSVVKSNADALGETFIYGIFGTYGNEGTEGTHFGLTFDSGNYWGTFGFKYTIVSADEIKMEYAGTNYGNAAWYAANANYNYCLPPFGYANAARTFKLTTDNLKAPTYVKLTDESDPTNVIVLSASVVQGVFSN